MILVTGGTGFVGREVVRELLALGHPVRLLVRDPRRAPPHPAAARLELAIGDALQPATLPAALAGVQTVIHLIGIIAETSRVTFAEAHFDATRNVLDAARQAGVTRWIQMSAIGTRPRARSRYHLTKWQAEEEVRRSGLDWTIFRPSLVYGHDERDRFLNLLRRALSPPLSTLQLHTFPVLDGGHPLIQPVSVREVARCFAHAPSTAASIGKTYDLVGPVPMTWRGMIFRIAAFLGQEAIYEEIPLLIILRKLLWIAALLLPVLALAGLASGDLTALGVEIAAGVWALLLAAALRWKKLIVFSLPSAPLEIVAEGLNGVLPRQLQFSEQLKMAVEDNAGDPRPAAEAFGYTPETFDEGLARCYGVRSAEAGM